MRDLLTARGFRVVRNDDLLPLASTLPIEISRPGSLRSSRVVVADRD